MSDVIDGEIVDDLPAPPAPDPLPEAQRKMVESLRALADFYEQRPGLPLPYLDNTNVFCQEKDLPNIAWQIGACDKTTLGDTFFMLRKKIGPSLELQFLFDRDTVCERVVVGRETVEEKVPVTYETRTITRDKVEWHCPKSIMDKPALAAPTTPVAPAATDEDVPF